MRDALTNKVAIVTDAGRMRGIGRAIALRLAQDGADAVVTAVARSPESFPEHEREANWRGAGSVADEVRALDRRALALELAPHNVTVNCIAPGSTDTDMMDGTFRRTGERLGVPFEMVKGAVANFIPLRRQADPSEIASVVSYLASPNAAYITGQTISVDGGVIMR